MADAEEWAAMQQGLPVTVNVLVAITENSTQPEKHATTKYVRNAERSCQEKFKNW